MEDLGRERSKVIGMEGNLLVVHGGGPTAVLRGYRRFGSDIDGEFS